jgi:hypothetical protein
VLVLDLLVAATGRVAEHREHLFARRGLDPPSFRR